MEALMIGYGDGILKSSLGKLGSFLLSEALLIRGVREDIRFIRDELQSMDAILHDLIRAGLLDQQNKVWMLHVLQVACDAEICMDEFAEYLGKHPGPGITGAVRRAGQFVATVVPRCRIAKMIQELKIRAMEVSQRHSRYTITVPTTLPDINEMTRRYSRKAQQNEMLYSHSISEDALLGIERSFKQLLENMKVFASAEETLRVAAIVGPAGSGKTTLAKMVHRRRNDPDKSIQASVWVTLSKERNTEWVLQDILSQLNGGSELIENYDKHRLQEEVKKQLTQKRFLLILDAFWRKEDWDEIEDALPVNPNGFIVLTTRYENLLPDCCTTDNIIKPNFSSTSSMMLIMMVLNLTSKWDTLMRIMGWFGSLKKVAAIWFINILVKIILAFFWLGHFTFKVENVLRTIPLSENAQSRQVSFVKTVTKTFQHQKLQIFINNVGAPIFGLINIFLWVIVLARKFFTFLLLVMLCVIVLVWKFFIMSIPLVSMIFQRGVYFHLTSVKQVPMYRAKTFMKLISLGKPIFLLAPWALKFICGALVCESMDFHTTDKFFQDLGSLFEKLNGAEAEQKLKEVIKCCHQILSPTLRRCAEDLNILPDGYAVKRKRLTRRWVALDLVSPAPGLSREEVAEGYFHELMVRGFIEPESVNTCGKIKLCRINTMFKEFLTKNRENDQQTLPLDNNASFQLYDTNPCTALEPAKRLSSLNPESLTILDLEGCKGLKKKQLSFLYRCTKLRYLSLRNTDLTEIPKKRGKLHNLETLDISHTEIKKVSEGILHLRRLKHLFAGCIQKPESDEGDLKLSTSCIEVPAGIEQMSNLETLAYVEATKASNLLLSLGELSQLKRLGLVIRDTKLNSKPLCISLMKLSISLLSLSIIDEREENSLEFLEYLFFLPLKLKSLTLRGYLEKLPQWIRDHKHLAKLTIADTRLRSDAIRLIGKIPTLLCLKLYNNSFEEHDLTLESKEFPVLRVLIIHCDVIQKIRLEKGTTPRLEVFRWVCSKALPKEIYGINYLRMLRVISLIGDVHAELQADIHNAVRKHPNYETPLVFEKVKKNEPEKR